MGKRYLSVIVLTSLIVIIISSMLFSLFLHPETMEIFPTPGELNICTYTDSEDPLGAGNSEIISFTVDSTIFLSALIKGKIDYPYAGFRIEADDSLPFYDIRKYDHIEIAIDSTNATFFIIDLTTYIEGDTHFNNYMSFRHHTKQYFVVAEPQMLKIPIKELETQDWWYRLRNTDSTTIGEPDFSRCRTISFEINSVKPTHTPLYMSVSSITFVNRRMKAFWGALFLLGGWSSMVVFLLKRRTSKPTIIQGKALDLKNCEEEDLERLCNFIAESYQDPDLTITTVAKHTGVSSERIPQLLMRNYQMQYKQYLNTVRITEARRLLKETDRQVSEIATVVGYNYPTTFNRVFKEITGQSPRDFRKSAS